MADQDRPSLELARRVLPGPLLEALRHVFGQGLSGCWLVGGTALAGFYAGHRRSDDMDLFVRDAGSHQAAVLAVESLQGVGARVEVVQRSAQYFKALCRLRDHAFAADVALHPSLFDVGEAVAIEGGIRVASLRTLLMLKVAALVSRCAEKDLYDVLWLLRHGGDLPLEDMVGLGLKIDAGATPEGLLIAVSGSRPSRESCGFSLERRQGKEEVYKHVLAFQRRLVKGLARLCEKQPAPSIAEMVKKVRGLTRRGRPR